MPDDYHCHTQICCDMDVVDIPVWFNDVLTYTKQILFPFLLRDTLMSVDR